MEKHIFWDLDGTLTDSSEGILNCVRMTLDRFDLDYDESQLRRFIGPPLRDMFPEFGVPKDRAEEAVQIYRSRYNTIGKFENKPYPGICDLLESLRNEGFHNYVATSKPEHTSLDILNKFDMTKYFDVVCGATDDGRIDSKDKVIQYLLTRVDNAANVVMIGDSEYDIIGAKAHGIETIIVNWGFGDRQKMEEADPICFVDTMDQLYEAIQKRLR